MLRMHHSTQLHCPGRDKAGRSSIAVFARSSAPFQIDVEKYQAMIDDERLSEEQRRELILGIWSLLMIVMDLGLKLKSLKA